MKNKALLVELSSEEKELFKQVLNEMGIEVTNASSMELNQEMKTDDYCLAIVNLGILKTNPELLINEAKFIETRMINFPILGVVDEGRKGNVERALFNGCDGVLLRPLDTKTVVETLIFFLDN